MKEESSKINTLVDRIQAVADDFSNPNTKGDIGENVSFCSLAFEVTRRCNLRCGHCLRGEPQDIDMNKAVIDKVLDQTNIIGSSILLTGGEPFLVPEVIEHLVDSLIERNIMNYGIRIVTNGTIIDDRAKRIFASLIKLSEWLKGKYIAHPELFDGEHDIDRVAFIRVGVSNDIFHNNDYRTSVDLYKSLANNFIIVEPMMLKDSDDGMVKEVIAVSPEKWLSNAGRISEHPKYKDTLPKKCKLLHKVEFDKRGYIKCPITICVNGNIVIDEGDFSFEMCDSFAAGNVLEKPISCIINDHNYKHPLTCRDTCYCEKFIEECENNKELTQEQHQANLSLVDFFVYKKEIIDALHKKYPFLTSDDLATIADIFVEEMIRETQSDSGDNLGSKKRILYDEEALKMFTEEDKVAIVENLSFLNHHNEQDDNTLFYSKHPELRPIHDIAPLLNREQCAEVYEIVGRYFENRNKPDKARGYLKQIDKIVNEARIAKLRDIFGSFR